MLFHPFMPLMLHVILLRFRGHVHVVTVIITAMLSNMHFFQVGWQWICIIIHVKSWSEQIPTGSDAYVSRAVVKYPKF